VREEIRFGLEGVELEVAGRGSGGGDYVWGSGVGGLEEDAVVEVFWDEEFHRQRIRYLINTPRHIHNNRRCPLFTIMFT